MPDPYQPEDQGPEATHGALAERVSDADRDRTVTLLREQVVVGRLTLEEFSERVGLTLESRTRGDLNEALFNLPEPPVPEDDSVRRRSRRWFVAVMSGSQAKGRWRITGRTTAVAIMGGCTMDLRHAEIDGPEITITAFAFWGGINVIVPEGFDVQMEGFSFMGGRDLKLRNMPPVPGSPRIRIRGFSVMGGIDVRSRPSRTVLDVEASIADHVVQSVSGAAEGLADPSGSPIDLDALRRDIKAQLRSRRGADRPRSRDSRQIPQTQPQTPPTGQRSADLTQNLRSPGESTVTILFSDMVNYAGMTERLGDPASRELLRVHHHMVREALERHGGREIKVQGDGFMVAFAGVARALRCAADMQRAFVAYSDDHGDHPIRIHIGVHTGEAVEEDDDFLGHTVIVASRLADQAAPGEILVSAVSAQLVERTGEFRFVDNRETVLKGLTRSQRVATLVWAV